MPASCDYVLDLSDEPYISSVYTLAPPKRLTPNRGQVKLYGNNYTICWLKSVTDHIRENGTLGIRGLKFSYVSPGRFLISKHDGTFFKIAK